MGPEELLDLFVQEATEMVRELEQGLILLEVSPRDAQVLNRVFRAAHTIKGNAGIVGLDALAGLTHAMESLLDAVRKDRIAADEGVISSLLEGLDLVRAMVAEARNPTPVDRDADRIRVTTHIEALAAGRPPPAGAIQGPVGPSTGPGPAVFELDLQFAPEILEAGHDPTLLIEELATIGTLDEVTADVGKLPDFKAMDVRRSYLSWRVRMTTTRGRKAIEDLFAFVPGRQRTRIREVGAPGAPIADEPPAVAPARVPPVPLPAPPPARIPEGLPPAEPAPAPAPDTNGRSDTVRVSVKILDRLMDLAGEMVLTRNQLLQSTRLDDARLLERTTQRVDLLTAEMQDAIMATRMQSIRVVFEKFNRTARDLSHELGKRVRLVLEDEGVELDRTIIEAIADPLAHLVRNAIDHGIESPEERLAAGKPAEATLKLRARQSAGQVLVDVIDDGRGIDPERVREHAIAAGLLRREETHSLSPKAVRDLLFRPGFSTASTVSHLSGRGVGLDVVQSNLAAVGGTVQLDSTPGRGCAFHIRLPLTLAILPCLLVEAEGERFAIPQVSLVELVRVRAADVRGRIERLAGVDVARIRGELVPIVRLRSLLGVDAPTCADPDTGQRRPDRRANLVDRRGPLQPAPQAPGAQESGEARGAAGPATPDRREGSDRRSSPASAMNLAIVSAGDYTYGLVVDNLLDTVEIVVKPLGRNLNDCQCYAGATVLGDGRVALILDVAGLGRRAWIAEKAEAAAANHRAREARAQAAEVERVPLLLLEGGEHELFGVPLDMVERIRKVDRSELVTVGGRRVLRGALETLPLVLLDQVIPAKPLPDLDTLHVMQFRAGNRELGLLATSVSDIVEVPANFDATTHRQPGIRGSMILADRVLLLLDLREIASRLPGGQDVPPASSTPDSRRPRLLVAEDSPFFLSHISGMMEEAGYDVARAHNGAVALELLTRTPERFDVVLTDIEMPELDGFELVERMRSHPVLAKIPVLAVTSLLGAEARQRGLDVGIDEYSIKLDRDDVLERCRRLLEHGREPR